MKWLYKYRVLLLIIFSGSLLFGNIYLEFKKDFDRAAATFQERFLEKERSLDRFIEIQRDLVRHRSDFAKWQNFNEHSSLYLHVFSGDSLIYWNTNRVPIRQFADIHFPSDGILHLQNGWYYAKVFKQNEITVCASFLVREEYAYENKNLKNQFTDELQLPFSGQISLEKEDYPIFDKHGNFLFSLIPDDVQTISSTSSLWIAILFLVFLSSLLWLLYLQLTIRTPVFTFFSVVLIVFLRFLSLKYNWIAPLQDLEILQPNLYASNEFFPTFLDYLINCVLILFLVALASNALMKLQTLQRVSWILVLLFLTLFPIWHLILILQHGLIENSSIPMIIDRLFSLNSYSILAIVSIGAIFFGYYHFSQTVLLLLKRSGRTAPFVAVILFVAGISYFVLEIIYGNELLVSSLFPMLLLSLLTFKIFREESRYSLSFGVLFLIVFSALLAINLAELTKQKEKSERVLYANQLSTEKDIVTELEYANLAKKITADAFLQKFISNPLQMGVSDFEDAMERRYFKGFWERYEMSFNFFDGDMNSLIVDESQNVRYEDLEQLIASHGAASEVDPNIFFIRDYIDQYSYIIKQPLESKDGKKATLFCRLRSKKIPEEIGFPRLLISSKANVVETLENYSIARYYKGKLVTRYGNFNYPTNNKSINQWRNSTGFVDYENYNHFVLQKTSDDMLILSSRNYRLIELITSFSYLFCFFGLLLIPFILGLEQTPIFEKALSLSAKIRFILIGLVLVALVGFGWGSGVFVRNQYNDYTNGVIREKMNSVDTELRSKIGTKKALDIERDGNYTEYLLRKFSKVFVTDINIYNKQGVLIASSRPKVFNIGLISEQMNPKAYFNVHEMSKSDFIHQENIGNLGFLSAYQPLYNNNGDLLGYINLQHFGQQKDFENQIQRFLVSIINVFMLLLAISVILALFVSNWLTAPLRLLQESFAGVRFGAHNQKIDYRKDDEIGALVKDYNKKLEELEFAAEKLAQNERESAWREMAKQVAHEIKNPLTPMKLSVQQLLRVYDPENPASAQKLEKVVSSLIEQIDVLTNIANEFSNFAKMPRPNEECVDLISLIRSVIEIFSNDDSVHVELETSLQKASVMADKDQLLRVFNNLIKNATQAVLADKKSEINIKIDQSADYYNISVSDNGSGISPEQKAKLFVPYFTTKSTGSGLGLAMCKQIIESHRGTIDLDSTSEYGTAFTITLPRID